MITVSNTATVVVSVCAVILTVVVVRREFVAQPQPQSRSEVVELEEWRHLEVGGRILGSADAPVRVIEFSDFQCPFCRQAARELSQMLERYSGQVAIVYRHLPLEQIHPHALDAALASECAADHSRFREYHDLLFEVADSIGLLQWTDIAERAGVADSASFGECVRSRRHLKRVEADVGEAMKLRIVGTPTFILGGRMVSGLPGFDRIRRWVDSMVIESATSR